MRPSAPLFHIDIISYRFANPIVEIRLSLDRHISTMGNPIRDRRQFIFLNRPWVLNGTVATGPDDIMTRQTVFIWIVATYFAYLHSLYGWISLTSRTFSKFRKCELKNKSDIFQIYLPWPNPSSIWMQLADSNSDISLPACYTYGIITEYTPLSLLGVFYIFLPFPILNHTIHYDCITKLPWRMQIFYNLLFINLFKRRLLYG